MARRSQRSTPTLSDVARHAGVSLATASRAINGSSTRTVGEELGRRVRESARILGYAPDANAQAMARGATRTIGVVVHDLTDPYFAAVADALTKAAAERELFTTLATTGNHVEDLAAMVSALDSMRVRAILLVGASWKDPDLMEKLRSSVTQYIDRGGRVITLGMDFPGLDGVTIDNEAGAHALAEHLVELGYRRPLLLAGHEKHSTAVARSDAFARRMAELGHPVDPTNTISSDFTRAGGQVGMRLAIETGLEFDVIVAMTDVMALGALQEARASGLQIPRDAGLTGFGDIATLVDVTPGLTTVRIPTTQMAEMAMRMAIDGPGDGSGQQMVDVTLVLRDSTPRRTT